ncbi:MAG: PH domain-containing protein [Anaerolineaceae bacterium]|nr:PH domain-containing protein [Anaerolineaceae bacterium]
MNIPTQFKPHRQTGMIIHLGFILVLGALGTIFFFLALEQQEGSRLILFIALALLILAPLPLLIYRAFALLQARYDLERDGLRIRWGLRAEDIPLPDIEWIRPASDLGYRMPLPLLRWPGAILGNRMVEGLGPVEYMASDFLNMLLVATPTKIYAISPEQPGLFLNTFQRTTEMGSPTPLESQSTLPAIFFRKVWNDIRARILIIAGSFLAFALFAIVSVAIPSRERIALGFSSSGKPLPAGPSESLILLPALAGLVFFLNLFLGLYFFRSENHKVLAYILWTGSSLTSILLLIAVGFIL